jgi:hypothetical protein
MKIMLLNDYYLNIKQTIIHNNYLKYSRKSLKKFKYSKKLQNFYKFYKNIIMVFLKYTVFNI